MKREDFLVLSKENLDALIQQRGGLVCVFPINGTRRWYQLEHPPGTSPHSIEDYIEVSGRAHIDLYKLFFGLGIKTLLTPIFDMAMLNRYPQYGQLAADGLLHIVKGEEFRRFFDTYDVRVRFYGSYEDDLPGTVLEPVIDKLKALEEQTQSHQSYRLFFGVCSANATDIVIDQTLKFYQEYGRQPTHEELITYFYGESVAPADIFIGFGKFSIFSMPMLADDGVDYYFTVSPSLYMSEHQLREILYDKLFGRPNDNDSYGKMLSEDQDLMRAFYHANRNTTLGVGIKQERGHYWYPLTRINYPKGF